MAGPQRFNLLWAPQHPLPLLVGSCSWWAPLLSLIRLVGNEAMETQLWVLQTHYKRDCQIFNLNFRMLSSYDYLITAAKHNEYR